MSSLVSEEDGVDVLRVVLCCEAHYTVAKKGEYDDEDGDNIYEGEDDEDDEYEDVEGEEGEDEEEQDEVAFETMISIIKSESSTELITGIQWNR
eukprot:CAMPEP_0170067274 /NCGR_PEP_ID=MMETSP0019_2-20121128/6688_1 /TAXON_ID=98059 /ORGANISM="Dinobryon sp., Strain UTEXLB2267" /LENGTH=93 /DNA_ID=CAMNT_0010274633 /DNA_START=339 /DNA_END=619 /DNA_ORIENTATION=-